MKQRRLILEFEKDTNNLNMLILPGGGIKGYMTALTTQAICKEFNIKEENFIDDYDVIGGTSIGGILAIALICGITPSKLVLLFEKNKHRIFNKDWTPSWIVTLNFIISGKAKYDRKGLIEVLKENIPNIDKLKIKDLNKKILLTTLKTETIDGNVVNTPLYITNISSVVDYEKTKEFTLLDACCMTSAAPMYFEPYIKDKAKFIDGGVWRNNPVTAIINSMRSYNIYSKRQCILTIGCGKSDFVILPDKNQIKELFTNYSNKLIEGYGSLKLMDGLKIIMHVLQSSMSASQEASHYDTVLYEDYNCLYDKAYYLNFEPNLKDAEDPSLDNTSDKFFKYMQNKIEETFKIKKDKIKQLYNRIRLN